MLYLFEDVRNLFLQ